MTEQEAFEKWWNEQCTKSHPEGKPSHMWAAAFKPDANLSWHAALAWMWSQGEPIGVIGCDTVLWKKGICPPENTLLYTIPQTASWAIWRRDAGWNEQEIANEIDRLRTELRGFLSCESDKQCCNTPFKVRGYDPGMRGYIVGHTHGGDWLHCATFVELSDAERYVWIMNIVRHEVSGPAPDGSLQHSAPRVPPEMRIELAMAAWNAMTEQERVEALRAAGSDRPVDAMRHLGWNIPADMPPNSQGSGPRQAQLEKVRVDHQVRNEEFVMEKRKEFEEWFLFHEGSRGKYRLDRVTAGPFEGDYRDGQVQGAWNAWSAAISTFTPLSDKKIREMADDGVFLMSLDEIVRTIERAHGIGA